MNQLLHPQSPSRHQATDRNIRFLVLFGLANAAGVIAYTPLLTLLLPAKIEYLAGQARIDWLSASTLFGAIAASAGNVLFGWASDVTRNRRGWMIAGLVATLASYFLIHAADSKSSIVTAIVLFQIAMNMFLAPMFAWAADTVPDRQKGLLGGLLSAGPPVAALAGVAVTSPALTGDGLRFSAVCLLVLLLSTPLIVMGRSSTVTRDASTVRAHRGGSHADFAFAWVARLLMQVACNIMFAFLLYYFGDLPEPLTQSRVAMLSAVSMCLSFPITLAAGRLSDRVGPRKPFLLGSGVLAAAGLTVMAVGTGATAAIAGYILFSCAAAIFSAFHTAYSMQLLPSSKYRGRDLGILNLTNTLPAIVAPVLALMLVPGHGFSRLLGVLAVLVCIASGCVLFVRRDEQSE